MIYNRLPGHRLRVRVRFLRGFLGEDKPSPLLWTTWRLARSIVGAMACPRPAWAAASFARTCARCNNRTHTPTSEPIDKTEYRDYTAIKQQLRRFLDEVSELCPIYRSSSWQQNKLKKLKKSSRK